MSLKSIISLEYLITFLLIYTSRETLLFGTNNNNETLLVGYIVPILLLLLLFLLGGSSYLQYAKPQKLCITLSIFTAITMLLNVDINIKYGYELLLFVLALKYVKYITFKRFTEIYSNIMYYLSVFSAITAILYMLYPSYVLLFPTIVNKGGLYFYNLFFALIPAEMDGVYFRMYGIFREPGVAMIFINLAIIFELFIKKVKNYKKILVFILAIGLTFSTAGYIVTFLILVSFLFASRKINSSMAIVVLLLIIASTYIVYTNKFVYMLVFSKFSNSESSSTAARFGSVVNNLNLLYNHPQGIIYGLGYQNVEDAFVNIGNRSLGEEHNTNTVLKELAVHGFFFTYILFSRIYKFFKNNFSLSKQNTILLFVVVLLMLGNEDISFNIILFILAFYSFRPKCKLNTYEH